MFSAPLTLLLLVFAVDTSKQENENHVPTSERIANNQIIFSRSELTVSVRSPYGTTFHIDAFKVKRNDNILLAISSNPQAVKSLQFMSAGHPMIVAPPKVPLGAETHKLYPLVMTAKGFHFYVKMLPQSHREALAAVANAKYKTAIKIDQSQILLLTPVNFTCDFDVGRGLGTPNELTYSVKANVKWLRRDPLKVNFRMEQDRLLYSELINDNIERDEVEIRCQMFLTPDFEQRREYHLRLPSLEDLLKTTATVAITTPVATTDATSYQLALTTNGHKGCQNVYETRVCQKSSDCCQWNTSEYKMATSCGSKNKLCSCIAPQDTCSQGLVCCDGTTCKHKCPPAPKFHYCKTNTTDSCQACLRCAVDTVTLQVWPPKTPNGRCVEL